MTPPSKIRLLLADDHEVLCYGIKALLAGTEIKVIAEVAIVAVIVWQLWRHDGQLQTLLLAIAALLTGTATAVTSCGGSPAPRLHKHSCGWRLLHHS